MGNGVLRRYRTRPEADNDSWRKPKQKGGAANKEKVHDCVPEGGEGEGTFMSDASLDVFSFQCLHLEFYLLQAAAVATATGHSSSPLPRTRCWDAIAWPQLYRTGAFAWFASATRTVSIESLNCQMGMFSFMQAISPNTGEKSMHATSTVGWQIKSTRRSLLFWGTMKPMRTGPSAPRRCSPAPPCSARHPLTWRFRAQRLHFASSVLTSSGLVRVAIPTSTRSQTTRMSCWLTGPQRAVQMETRDALLCYRSSSTILINAANCGSGRQERALIHGPVVVDICRIPSLIQLVPCAWRIYSNLVAPPAKDAKDAAKAAETWLAGGPKGLGGLSSSGGGAGGGSGAARPGAGLASIGKSGSQVPVSPSSTAPQEDDDDNDLAGFSGLADAANKVWDDLMARKGGIKGKQDMNSLFGLAELKDAVERSVKRTNVLQQQVDDASSNLEDKQASMEDLRRKIEANTSTANVHWKLGDMAVRRGKGLCELSMVQMHIQPPCFEVRMLSTGTIVSTEYEKLVPLSSQQQVAARSALKELEEAKGRLAAAEEGLLQAQEELRQQHQSLTEQVEVKLKEPLAPPGMPDFGYLQKANAQSSKADAAAYPEVKGVKEDLRKPAAAAREASKDHSRADPGTPVSSSAGNTLPRQAPGGPAGFPSFQDLNRMQKEAEDRSKTEAARAASYPAPHATREVFSKPEGADRSGSTAAGSGTGPSTAGQEPPGRTTPSEMPFVPAGMPGIPSNTGAAGSGAKASLQQERAKQEAFLHHQEAQLHREEAQRHQQQEAQRQREEAERQQRERYEEQQRNPGQGQPGQPERQKEPDQPPTDWVRYKTPDGQVYYHNERTNHTAWSLPPGATCRDPAAPSQQGSSQAQSKEDDPFADLRKQEEENQKQHEQWKQWYQQYTAWYSQQGAAGAAGTAGTESGKQGQSGQKKQQQQKGPQGEQTGYVPPRGPAPPKLDAAFEDHAVYQIKSSVLKEMESMVNQGLEVAKRKKALRCLQLRWHPDKNPDKLEVANSIFQFIEETKPWFLHDPNAE
ncbi:unnamed protein product [Symbiodinium natans]|uniref:WW domain-containing protein n=1 Tax=Symbiodinium natans TaxID=878477 RepID=A0A812NBG6_9DINO|nr:unnamed protein product [Symbiodinium natans]